MADRNDEDLDTWLSKRIEPLPPPPGTFDLIKRRARRRKLGKLAISAGAAAVIVAAAVTVPQVVNLPVLPSPTQSPAAGRSAHTTAPPSPSASVAASSASPSPSPSASTPPGVPPNFRPTSVTFIGRETGWVIGQAGTPGHCATPYCTSLARTNDAGKTWIGVPAPLTGAPEGGTGVSQVRFLNRVDGWAFGPGLFATSDSGHTWTPVSTSGQRVIALETVGDRAFAVFASCTGTGYADGCTTFSLYSSPAGTADWAEVGPATSGLTGPYGSASLALTGSRGYLLGPDGTLYSGPVDGSAAWSRVGPVPCAATLGKNAALLAAVSASDLVLECTGTTNAKAMYSSANGGASWQQIPAGPTAGIASSLAASPGDTVVLGTDQGIDILPAGAAAWQAATVSGAPAGGFGYVGMTTQDQGIALPADPASGQVWFTFDGGQSWQPSRVA
jgi:hypothetical protein